MFDLKIIKVKFKNTGSFDVIAAHRTHNLELMTLQIFIYHAHKNTNKLLTKKIPFLVQSRLP